MRVLILLLVAMGFFHSRPATASTFWDCLREMIGLRKRSSQLVSPVASSPSDRTAKPPVRDLAHALVVAQRSFSTKIQDAKIPEGPVPDANGFAALAAESRENQNLVRAIQQAPRQHVEFPGSRPVLLNEDTEQLLALGDRAIDALKAGGDGNAEMQALQASLRRLGQQMGGGKGVKAGDALASIVDMEGTDREKIRRLEQFVHKLREIYQSEQNWAGFLGQTRQMLELVAKLIRETDPYKQKEINAEIEKIQDTMRDVGTEQNRLTISGRKLEEFYARHFGGVVPTIANVEKMGWLLGHETEIASKSQEFLRTLKAEVGQERKIDDATPEEVERASASIWPRPPKPASARAGLIPDLGVLRTSPVVNGFSMRSPRFVIEVVGQDLVGRAAALANDPRVPEPRREFLARYLRFLKRWNIPMEEGDEGISSVVVFLEQLYPKRN